jgi:predicted permease
VTGSVVTASYFTVLGIRPAAGRFFRADEDQAPGRDPVAVLSHRLWRQRFAASPAAIGSTIQINGTAFTVIGVTPEGFSGVLTRGGSSDLWIPSAMFRTGYRYCDAFVRDCTIVQMLGRLGTGVSREAAQAELDRLAAQLAAQYPATHRDLGLEVVEARGAQDAQEDARAVGVLLAAVAILLAIACANLAGLLLARGIGRRREMAARLAVGATRGRLVRQLLTESMVLAVAGGSLGILVAFWATDLVQALYGVDYAGRALNIDVRVNPLVLAATLALSIVAGLTFGVSPAWQAGAADVMTALRDELAAGGAWRARAQNLLVAGQVALSIILLIGAVLTVRSLQFLYRPAGYDPSGVIVLRLRPSLVDYSIERGLAFQREAIRRLQALPGVTAASPSEFLPVFGAGAEAAVWTPGREPASPADAPRALVNRVGPDFFKTLGVAPIEGREFSESDPEGLDTIMVSASLARRLWPAASALDRPLVVDGRTLLVIGVVPDLEYRNALTPAQPSVHLNYWRRPKDSSWVEDSRTHVRVAGDPGAMMTAIRREVAALDPGVPISEDYPLADRIAYHFRPVRVASLLFSSFGLIAAFLSIVGLYGVLALMAQLRAREMAIRVALGADRRNIAGVVAGHGVRLAALGGAVGVGASAALVRALDHVLYGVSAYDPWTFVAVPAAILILAAAASLWPARRAARVDPALALRSE